MKILFCLILLITVHHSVSANSESLDDLLEMPLEDLLSMEVTSVTKKSQSIANSAAAVYVITQKMIQNSGVTSIPEALRLAPGLQVAQITSNKWAISSRGFNGFFANKLLVLIDGRSVYTPAFSGVYWDQQDILLEDIERIEVIRGPGATLWGSNAVNGVINIISKSAVNTTNGLVTLGTGSHQKRLLGFRYGNKLNQTTYGRFYLKQSNREDFEDNPFPHKSDDWDQSQIGFRMDGHDKQHNWTVQGDYYQSKQNQFITFFLPNSTIPVRVNDEMQTRGWNLLAQWQYQFSSQSIADLQLYYDDNYRQEIYLTQTHHIFDVDFQHQFKLGTKQSIIWGLGYRRIKDKFDNSFSIGLFPDEKTVELYSGFIQDEIELFANKVYFTLGSKFEDNDYTGMEYQPNLRLLWKINPRNTLWTAVSYAVRTPSRISHDVILANAILLVDTPGNIINPNIQLFGNPKFDAEKLMAYELGYRVQAQENLSLDISGFYYNYRDLRSYDLVTNRVIFDNNLNANSIGLETIVDWQVKEWWQLKFNYTYINIDASLDNSSMDTGSKRIVEGSTAEHQISLTSFMQLSPKWSMNLWWQYIDEIPVASSTALQTRTKIDDYLSLNAKVTWQATTRLELSLIGRHLLDNQHPEFIGEAFIIPTEVKRSIYGMLKFHF